MNLKREKVDQRRRKGQWGQHSFTQKSLQYRRRKVKKNENFDGRT